MQAFELALYQQQAAAFLGENSFVNRELISCLAGIRASGCSTFSPPNRNFMVAKRFSFFFAQGLT